MSAARKAVEVWASEDDAVVTDAASAPAPDAMRSPARALQAAVAAAYVSADSATWPEPEVQQWPRWARLAFLVAAAAGSWALVGGLVGLALRH